MNALQRLDQNEEKAILSLVRANGLDESQLACYMTRQRDSGRGKFSDGQPFNISYNLMLCEFCGNLMPSRCCPAKVKQLKERMRALSE
jgi:hypothetical protein